MVFITLCSAACQQKPTHGDSMCIENVKTISLNTQLMQS